MDSGNRADICNSVFPFTLETPPYHEGGSDGVNRRRTIPKTLNLFPLTPNLQTFEQDSPVRPTSARHGPRPRSSPFRGVTHYKRTGRWEAHIWNKGKQIYLGASSTAQKAARAYDRAAIHFRGMGAELNFTFEDYATELQQLVEVSDAELEAILRKQSAGEGTLYPEYPARIQLPLHTPKLFGVPLYSASQHRTKPGHRGP